MKHKTLQLLFFKISSLITHSRWIQNHGTKLFNLDLGETNLNKFYGIIDDKLQLNT